MTVPVVDPPTADRSAAAIVPPALSVIVTETAPRLTSWPSVKAAFASASDPVTLVMLADVTLPVVFEAAEDKAAAATDPESLIETLKSEE